MSGATWRRSVRPQLRRDRASRPRGNLVVRNGRDRSTSGRRAIPQRGDPAPPSSTDRALYNDDPRAGQRSRPRAGRRPGTATVGGQPGLGRKRLAGDTGRSTWPVERCPDAPGLRRPRNRSRLHQLSSRTLPAGTTMRTTNDHVVTAHLPVDSEHQPAARSPRRWILFERTSPLANEGYLGRLRGRTTGRYWARERAHIHGIQFVRPTRSTGETGRFSTGLLFDHCASRTGPWWVAGRKGCISLTAPLCQPMAEDRTDVVALRDGLVAPAGEVFGRQRRRPVRPPAGGGYAG